MKMPHFFGLLYCTLPKPSGPFLNFSLKRGVGGVHPLATCPRSTPNNSKIMVAIMQTGGIILNKYYLPWVQFSKRAMMKKSKVCPLSAYIVNVI